MRRLGRRRAVKCGAKRAAEHRKPYLRPALRAVRKVPYLNVAMSEGAKIECREVRAYAG
jgi:hypothetical protein